MDNPNVTDLIPPEQPVEVAKMLDAMPGLIGAIDQALIAESGTRYPFVLLVFMGKNATHATNIQPAGDAVKAVCELSRAWESMDAAPGDANPAA